LEEDREPRKFEKSYLVLMGLEFSTPSPIAHLPLRIHLLLTKTKICVLAYKPRTIQNYRRLLNR